jgi:hypothetical protein
MIKAVIFDEWIRRVNQLLDFCVDKTTESFEGVLWEKLYEAGYRPLEVVVALIEGRQTISQDNNV